MKYHLEGPAGPWNMRGILCRRPGLHGRWIYFTLSLMVVEDDLISCFFIQLFQHRTHYRYIYRIYVFGHEKFLKGKIIRPGPLSGEQSRFPKQKPKQLFLEIINCDLQPVFQFEFFFSFIFTTVLSLSSQLRNLARDSIKGLLLWLIFFF